MSNKFIKEEDIRIHKRTGLNEKSIYIKKDNGKMLRMKDIKAIGQKVLLNAQKLNKDAKLVIRAKNIITNRPDTLKSYDSDIDQMIADEIEYLNGRVKDTTNLTEYFNATFTVLY